MDYGSLGHLHSRDDASGRKDKHAGSVWFQMYLILIIHSFHICKSDYSPEIYFTTPKTYNHGTFTGISTHAERQKM